MKNKIKKSYMSKWDYAINNISSTHDIIFSNPSGDYVAHFIEDEVINNYKFPFNKKERA